MDTGRTERTRRAAGDLAEVTRDSYRMVVGRVFALRESNARVTRSFFEDTLEELHEQTEMNLRAMQKFWVPGSRQTR